MTFTWSAGFVINAALATIQDGDMVEVTAPIEKFTFTYNSARLALHELFNLPWDKVRSLIDRADTTEGEASFTYLSESWAVVRVKNNWTLKIKPVK